MDTLHRDEVDTVLAESARAGDPAQQQQFTAAIGQLLGRPATGLPAPATRSRTG